jgi:hypothetical protein
MLGKLLKSLWPRSPRRAPIAKPAAKAPIAAPEHSQLAVLSRLASVVAQQGLQVNGKEAPIDSTAGGARSELPILKLVARGHDLVTDELDAASAERVERFSTAFSRAACDSTLNVFVFHVDLAPGEKIDYVDAQFKPADFDYLDILASFIARLRAHIARPAVYLVTSEGARYRALAAADVRVVELPIDGRQPMYDRATALLAYARSQAFAADTACLDSDALVNRPLAGLFDLGFDVGLTYRNAERLMPVNEGVMFLRPHRRSAAASFLQRRLATYDRIARDQLITGYYGDVRRWRGGQLSLNALVYGALPCSPYRAWHSAGAMLRFLPCDTFNFAAAEGEAASSLERLEECYVIHYKGWRKHAFAFAARARNGTR